ncbi:MAG: hypothetical protein IIB26_01900 [Chloroflexi bacterium]|nr:hypothetical protein [Chloroflexota bacterium]
MSKSRSSFIYMWLRLSNPRAWLLAPIAAGIFIAIASLVSDDGDYDPPPVVRAPLENIVLDTIRVTGFSESPEQRPGVLAVDVVHANNFSEDELAALLSRVTARGYTVEFIGEFSSPFQSSVTRLKLLRDALRRADSLAIILPGEAYGDEESRLVEQFVEKGGRLLLLGDPTRPSEINSVAAEFGIAFQEGYLYNVLEHDLNYRNVFLRDFTNDPLTDGLQEVVFYTAGTIDSGSPVISTDSNTYSSMVERTSPFSPVVKARDGRVLALADLTFFGSPRNTMLDNARFIANIADYLTTGERTFTAADFPDFFADSVDIVVTRSSLLDAGTSLKIFLDSSEIDATIRGSEDLLADTVLLGLYEDASAASRYLIRAGVQVAEVIRTPVTPDISAAGTGLLVLDQSDRGRRVLVLLADSEVSLDNLVFSLQTGDFRGGLSGDAIAVLRFQ